MDAFMVQHAIERVSLLGYSMGGKISLSLLELMPKKVDQVLLFAPDGITIHPMYFFASKTILGYKLYRAFVVWPAPLFLIAKVAASIGIISNKLRNIVLFNTDTRAKRQLLHDAWMTYRNFNTDLVDLDRLLMEHDVKLHAYFGYYDKVITKEMARKMEDAMPNAQVHLLQSGHVDLINKAVRQFSLLGTKKGAEGPST